LIEADLAAARAALPGIPERMGLLAERCRQRAAETPYPSVAEGWLQLATDAEVIAADAAERLRKTT